MQAYPGLIRREVGDGSLHVVRHGTCGAFKSASTMLCEGQSHWIRRYSRHIRQQCSTRRAQ
ncbi:MAG: hypothetical protein ACREB5_01925 [Sphingomonadaceae bacterium]